jgi:hypothetical protein
MSTERRYTEVSRTPSKLTVDVLDALCSVIKPGVEPELRDGVFWWRDGTIEQLDAHLRDIVLRYCEESVNDPLVRELIRGLIVAGVQAKRGHEEIQAEAVRFRIRKMFGMTELVALPPDSKES